MSHNGSRLAMRFLAARKQISVKSRAAYHRRGDEMSHQYYADHRVLEVIARSPGILLDQIVMECSDLTWNQVFLILDRLSREGVLTMSPKGVGQYAITLSRARGAITAPICGRAHMNTSI
jgi:hypothetical protein